jgi:hypothetical protein
VAAATTRREQQQRARAEGTSTTLPPGHVPAPLMALITPR